MIAGAQAVDLRKVEKLGKGTSKLYNAIRKEIPIQNEDRLIATDINIYNFLTMQLQLEKRKIVSHDTYKKLFSTFLGEHSLMIKTYCKNSFFSNYEIFDLKN